MLFQNSYCQYDIDDYTIGQCESDGWVNFIQTKSIIFLLLRGTIN